MAIYLQKWQNFAKSGHTESMEKRSVLLDKTLWWCMSEHKSIINNNSTQQHQRHLFTSSKDQLNLSWLWNLKQIILFSAWSYSRLELSFCQKYFFCLTSQQKVTMVGYFCDDIATKFLPKVAQIFGNFWVILKNVAY